MVAIERMHEKNSSISGTLSSAILNTVMYDMNEFNC